MSDRPDFFRDFGIIPWEVPPPSGKIRCYFTWWRIISQYLGFLLLLVIGLGMGALFALTLAFPMNVVASAAVVVGFAFILYRGWRHDYLWVEMEETTIRARHYFSRRAVERELKDIEELTTMVFQLRSIETRIAEAFIGRIRGIEIRFRDGRTRVRVWRADPAMTNAKELIEAVIFRMWEIGPLDAEIVDFAGKPLIRRIYFKESVT